MDLDEKQKKIEKHAFDLLMEELAFDLETWKVYENGLVSHKLKALHEAQVHKKRKWDAAHKAINAWLDKNVASSTSFCWPSGIEGSLA